jgi:hypothetical protein
VQLWTDRIRHLSMLSTIAILVTNRSGSCWAYIAILFTNRWGGVSPSGRALVAMAMLVTNR